MTFIEIYNRIIDYWGGEIDFSDGVISEPLPEYVLFQSDSLFSKCSQIEEAIGLDDRYGNLMVWTMHQVFNKHACELFCKHIFTLHPKDISKIEIEEQYYKNLHIEGWQEELLKYERIIL